MSLSRDNVDKQMARWMTSGDDSKQPNPFRRSQMTTGDMRAKSPLQRFHMPREYFWNTHPRATTALTLVAFLTIFTGIKYNSIKTHLSKKENDWGRGHL